MSRGTHPDTITDICHIRIFSEMFQNHIFPTLQQDLLFPHCIVTLLFQSFIHAKVNHCQRHNITSRCDINFDRSFCQLFSFVCFTLQNSALFAIP